MMDIEKRRRQVAWLCFESYLSDEQRLESIQILERDFQSDGAVNLMAYIAKICMELGIDLQNHKTLYSKFHQLMAEPTELSVIDPLSLVQQEPQVASFVVDSVVIEASEPLSAPELTQRETPPPAYAVVFATFARFILEYTPNKMDLFVTLTEMVVDEKLKSQDLASYIAQWLHNPMNFAWSESLSQEALTRLVHLIYMALCDIVGPVAADDSFHRALAVCEQQPEARVFSPSQFL